MWYMQIVIMADHLIFLHWVFFRKEGIYVFQKNGYYDMYNNQ